MVRPSYRHRAGYIEIKNKNRQVKEESKKIEDILKEKEKTISDEEHKQRIEKLKELGLLK